MTRLFYDVTSTAFGAAIGLTAAAVVLAALAAAAVHERCGALKIK